MSQLFASGGQSIKASASASCSCEYSGFISFRMDWFDLLAVQGTRKSLLQHHSSKESILWCSVFLIARLSHPYMTTGKTIALTRWTFVGKVTSLRFHLTPPFRSFHSHWHWGCTPLPLSPPFHRCSIKGRNELLFCSSHISQTLSYRPEAGLTTAHKAKSRRGGTFVFLFKGRFL